MLQSILPSLIFINVAVLSFACKTSQPTVNFNASKNSQVENNSTVNLPSNLSANNSVNNVSSPISLATPQSTLKAYYEALAKKDDKLFRRTLSKRAERVISKNFAENGSLVDGVRRAMEYVGDSLEMPEVESETIEENTAVVKFKKGGQLKLVKEKNEWKMETTTVDP